MTNKPEMNATNKQEMNAIDEKKKALLDDVALDGVAAAAPGDWMSDYIGKRRFGNGKN